MRKIITIFLFCALASLLVLPGCLQKTNIESPTKESSASLQENATKAAESNLNLDELEKNITVKAVATESGQVCALITNNNKVRVDEMKVAVVFYDINNKPVGTDSDGHDLVLPNATVVSEFDLPNEYDHLETTITVEDEHYSSYENHSEKIEISQNIIDGGVIAQVKNNDTVTIDEIEIIAVFYRGDTIVGVSHSEDIDDLRSGKTETVELNCYSKTSLNDISFDKAEIYLNQAHTF
jgi:hypothetical protein